MGSFDVHKLLESLRGWFGGLIGTGDGYAAFTRRRVLRLWGIAAAVIVGFVVCGVAGYAIGDAQVGDADSAQQEGMAAGAKRGTAVGAREGYASTFKPARRHAYDKAYGEAYTAAYNDAFEQADLPAPEHVTVSEP
jgi:hypothetical protein